MSLTGKLAKIAIGIAVAKGVKKMMGGGNAQKSTGGLGSILGQLGQASQGQSGGGLGSILGQLGQSSGNQSGGLGSILGQLGQSAGGQSSGGLGGLLGSLAGAGSGSSSQSGVGGMLGSLLGGSQQSQSGGGLGGLLGSLAQGSNSGGGLGSLLNQAMDNFGEPETEPTTEDEQTAGILLSAMLQAAKADGQIDEEEKAVIMEHLNDASPEEMSFIQEQFNAPVDPEGLARSIPRGMEQQAYAMSLLAIDLDNKNEANYLHTFAQGLNLDQQTVNAIHSQMDEPALYS